MSLIIEHINKFFSQFQAIVDLSMEVHHHVLEENDHEDTHGDPKENKPMANILLALSFSRVVQGINTGGVLAYITAKE